MLMRDYVRQLLDRGIVSLKVGRSDTGMWLATGERRNGGWVSVVAADPTNAMLGLVGLAPQPSDPFVAAAEAEEHARLAAARCLAELEALDS